MPLWLTWKTAKALAPYLIGAVLVLGLVLWGHSKDASGYARAKAECATAVAADRSDELKRQLHANREALEQSRVAIETLIQERTALGVTMEENAVAASQDPDAAECGISADSVRRLNRVR